ncbi:MAG: lysine--tRNA ligase [Candidatus Caenarcaniphilales bacterium]|nr:lysine--tRNA ligase [Candidatus Caenarcaniphilales bacterium]
MGDSTKNTKQDNTKNETSKQETFKLRDERIKKRDSLRDLFKINPYLLHNEKSANPGADEQSQSAKDWKNFKDQRKLASRIKDDYENLASGEQSEKLEWAVGRIHSERNSGMFLDLYDESGKMQVVVERPDLENPDTYEVGEGEDKRHFLDLLDKGDFVACQGYPYRTPRGELSLKAKKLWILSKAIQPPPEIIENKKRRLGLTDLEVRYRQRYLDLMVNHEVKETFRKRAQIIAGLRNFLNQKAFLEFETPILQTEAGGAAARPFVTHHNALSMDLYLRIATELHLKRLIVGGFEKVFEIGRIFRNEGISTKHNPEFTSVEVYQAYADYLDLMKLTEDLVIYLAEKTIGQTTINYQGQELELKPQNGWKKIKMADLVKEVTGKYFDLENCSLEEAQKMAAEIKVDVAKLKSVGEILNEVFEQKCEETLIQPTFVTHYPRENSPLAFCSANSVENGKQEINANPKVLERFELFIFGREIANGFTELNDPEIQKRVFETQQKQRESGDLEAHPLDQDFIDALEFGMPPTGGLGVGIDRLVMLLTNSASIRDVILFPTVKPIV